MKVFDDSTPKTTAEWRELNNKVQELNRLKASRSLKEGDYESYLFRVERPHRTLALQRCIKRGLANDEPRYRALIRNVWMDCENARQHPHEASAKDGEPDPSLREEIV